MSDTPQEVSNKGCAYLLMLALALAALWLLPAAVGVSQLAEQQRIENNVQAIR